jgi:hypothetical protein
LLQALFGLFFAQALVARSQQAVGDFVDAELVPGFLGLVAMFF